MDFGNNLLRLDARADASIKSVNLYPSRAQTVRLVKVDVVEGTNYVVIPHLPSTLDADSLRVSCKGEATITGVTSSLAPRLSAIASPRLAELNVKLSTLQHALNRVQTARSTIDDYVHSIDIDQVDISKLEFAMDTYDAAEEKWDVKLVELELEIDALKKQVAEEDDTLRQNIASGNRARMEVTVNLIAPSTQQLELEIVYFVSGASWTPAYDIRAKLSPDFRTIKLVYKALIQQSTGEDWSNVLLSLGTVTPLTVGCLPKIKAWNIAERAPSAVRNRKRRLRRSSRFLDIEAEISDDDGDENEVVGFIANDDDDDDEEMQPPTTMTSVRSAPGSIAATFELSQRVTVRHSEDDTTHTVVIAELELDAQMAWVCVPRRDSSVYLSATITNTSHYTFLEGNCSSFVDGTYVSKCFLPGVCPQETFEFNLGPDPSVYTSYQSLPAKVTQSGYITTTRTHGLTGRIRVHNSKPVPLSGIRVIDHVPVSNDPRIVVKAVQPALAVPSLDAKAGATVRIGAGPDVLVREGVIARWLVTDRYQWDGSFEWVCDVPANGTIDLLVHCQVTSPPELVLEGV